jgi:methyltransferase-like protein
MKELLQRYPKRHENVAWRTVVDKALLVNPKDSFIYPLNTVATRIWELMDGKTSTEDIINRLSEEFEYEESEIQRDALEFLEELRKADLIEYM